MGNPFSIGCFWSYVVDSVLFAKRNFVSSLSDGNTDLEHATLDRQLQLN